MWMSFYSMTSSELPWVEKYRPSTLDDLVAKHEVINTSAHSVDRDLGHLPRSEAANATELLSTSPSLRSTRHRQDISHIGRC